MAVRPPPEIPGYDLREVLGRGAFGEVWSAERRLDGLVVALKVLRTPHDEEASARFRREARLARLVESPRTCRVVDAAIDGVDPAYIAFERLQGEALEARLDRESSIGLEETLAILDDVLEALEAAHAAGVVHRDVRPANVFLESLEPVRARLLDFGVAKAHGDALPTLETSAGSTLGSIAYMAPEQIGDAGGVDPRADVYAAGAVAFRALAGRPPFVGRSFPVLIALKAERDAPSLRDVTGARWPDAVEDLLRGALARDPDARFPTAAAAREAIAHVRGRVRAPRGRGGR